jgi:hypothetical protein
MSEGAGMLKDLLGGAADYYEFWKDYKGERICVRTHSINVGGEKRGKVRQNSYVIEGTVADVSSYPPGFLMKDVEEYIVLSDANMMFGVGSTEPVDVVGGSEGKMVLREIDEKYVSFDSIEELERSEIAEQATEPFRDEDDNS